ncbi:hypothetical protein R3P38DRAFT_3097893 [Favolaschia claudopus]|uniref:Uncharacterized protein n=1 Tax=Favolaschia claudopus TaxID=2862362 RepID=A0AAV9ZNF4_9AGAR
MERDPDGRPGYVLCKCRSHDCESQIWQADDGRILTGKWVSRSTKGRHRDEEEEFIQAGTLPPVRADRNHPGIVLTVISVRMWRWRARRQWRNHKHCQQH